MADLLLQERRKARAWERRERDARRGRIGPGRFDSLVKEMAGIVRVAFDAGATGSLFGLEGPLRHAIRSDLCLQSWRWLEADQMAREMMDETFRMLRAERPDWNEGQLEWTIEAGTLIERTRCARCHNPLPEGHHKFCGKTCASTIRTRRSARMKMTEEQVAASVASWT